MVRAEISLARATHNAASITQLNAGYFVIVVEVFQGRRAAESARVQMVCQLARNRRVTLSLLRSFAIRAGSAAGFALDAERTIIEYMVVADTARASTAGADSGFS